MPVASDAARADGDENVTISTANAARAAARARRSPPVFIIVTIFPYRIDVLCVRMRSSLVRLAKLCESSPGPDRARLLLLPSDTNTGASDIGARPGLLVKDNR